MSIVLANGSEWEMAEGGEKAMDEGGGRVVAKTAVSVESMNIWSKIDDFRTIKNLFST